MANQFLVEIHRHISLQMEQCRAQRREACSIKDASRISFFEGQLDELKTLRAFLDKSFNLLTQKYH